MLKVLVYNFFEIKRIFSVKKRLNNTCLKKIFFYLVQVYKGYVDDPRNTDNAWMETVACNFHDESGEVFGEFQLRVFIYTIVTFFLHVQFHILITFVLKKSVLGQG